MKFLANYSVILFYFLRFVEAAPESELTASVSTLLNPTISLIPCTIVEPLMAYLAGVCVLAGIVINVSTFLACVVSDWPTPFGNIFSSAFNGITDGAGVPGGSCSNSVSFYSVSVEKQCPSWNFTAINTVFVELANLGSVKNDMECGSPGYDILACLAIVPFVVLIQSLCGADTIALALGAVSTSLLPLPLNVLRIIINSMIEGGVTAGEPCDNVLTAWKSALYSKCPDFETLIKLLEPVLPSPS